MLEWSPPTLGLTDTQVVWRDGTVVCGGILGDLGFEARARLKAEEARKEELRQQTNVILLEDWRQND